MKRKYLASLLAATMLASLLTGCGSKQQTPDNSGSQQTQTESLYTKPTGDVDLTVWYAVSGATGETFEAQIAEYQK